MQTHLDTDKDVMSFNIFNNGQLVTSDDWQTFWDGLSSGERDLINTVKQVANSGLFTKPTSLYRVFHPEDPEAKQGPEYGWYFATQWTARSIWLPLPYGGDRVPLLTAMFKELINGEGVWMFSPSEARDSTYYRQMWRWERALRLSLVLRPLNTALTFRLLKEEMERCTELS